MPRPHPLRKKRVFETSFTVMLPWFSCLHNMWHVLMHFHTHMHTHTPTCTHTLQHKGSFNDVQAHLRQFHLEVEQGGGAIPINLETPTSLRKRYKADHRGAYVHQAGGGSTLSDVEVRINCDCDSCGHSPQNAMFSHKHKCKVCWRQKGEAQGSALTQQIL